MSQAVADVGNKDWDVLLARFRERCSKLPDSVPSLPSDFDTTQLRQWWADIAPTVKAELATDTTRACGHTCGTCPTRSTCGLHDALDIEDLGQ